MTVLRCAEAEALQEIKDITPEQAALIRLIWHTEDAYLVASLAAVAVDREALSREAWTARHGDAPAPLQDKMDAVDLILSTFGVCYLGIMRGSGNPVHYCNAGDPYAPTVVFSGGSLRVGTWGDLVAKGNVRERDTF